MKYQNGLPPLENCEKHRKSSLSSGKFLQLVLLSLKVTMSAQNQYGFLTNTLYYEAETGEQACLSIERYNIAITVRQWGRERRTIRKELLSSGSYKYQAANGEKETFMTYFSSGKFMELCQEERQLHTLRSCIKCQELHSEAFFLRRKNKLTIRQKNMNNNVPVLPVIQHPAEQPPQIPPQPPQFNTPKKVLQKFLEKTPESITQDDITEVGQQVLKPLTERSHKSEHQKHFYKKLFGKRKLPDAKYLSAKAKRRYIMQVNKEMQEENTIVDDNRVFTSNQSMVEWEKQRKKIWYLVKTRKEHTRAPSVNTTTMIYYCGKFYEIKTGITKQ